MILPLLCPLHPHYNQVHSFIQLLHTLKNTTGGSLEIQILTCYFHQKPPLNNAKGNYNNLWPTPTPQPPSCIPDSGSSSTYSRRHPGQHPVSHLRLLPLLPCSPPKVITSWPPLHFALKLHSSTTPALRIAGATC